MAFSKTAYEKAFLVKEEQRKNAERDYYRVTDEILKKEPRLTELKTKINMLGAFAVSVALSGDNARLKAIKSESEALSKEYDDLCRAVKLPLSPDYVCKACNDTGRIGGKVCKCVEKTAQGICFAELSADMPIADCRFDNFDLSLYPDEADGKANPREAAAQTLKICKNFVENFPCGKNLLFFGKPGLGKTHLSLAIAGEILGKGYGVVYSTAQKIVDSVIKERFSYSDSGETVSSIENCDLLIIDDLGTEISTAPSVAVINDVIDTRIMKNKSTVISTNLSPDEIEKRYDARVLSRLIGNYTKRTFLGEDIRQKLRSK